jgi:hypothetical protein
VPLGAGGKPKLNGAAPKAKAKAQDWTSAPRPLKVYEAARALVAETGEETFTRPQLAKAVGRSPETTRRAVERLREQERIRLAGKVGKGCKTAANPLRADAQCRLTACGSRISPIESFC